MKQKIIKNTENSVFNPLKGNSELREMIPYGTPKCHLLLFGLQPCVEKVLLEKSDRKCRNK